MSKWDTWLTLDFQAVLIKGDGIVALVNTGPAADLTAMNDGWSELPRRAGPVPPRAGRVHPGAAGGAGCAPEDVTHVILTPLQLYTVSNVLAFPNAAIRICAAVGSTSRRRTTTRTTTGTPASRRTSSPSSSTTAWDRVVLLDDEQRARAGLAHLVGRQPSPGDDRRRGGHGRGHGRSSATHSSSSRTSSRTTPSASARTSTRRWPRTNARPGPPSCSLSTIRRTSNDSQREWSRDDRVTCTNDHPPRAGDDRRPSDEHPGSRRPAGAPG